MRIIRYYNNDGEYRFRKDDESDKQVKSNLKKYYKKYGIKYLATIEDSKKGFYSIQKFV